MATLRIIGLYGSEMAADGSDPHTGTITLPYTR
jgi:hypothetical protein